MIPSVESICWRRLYFDRGELEFRTYVGITVVLELADGGGHTKSLGVWRIGRRVVRVVEAGEA